jgi:hypothetical protein
MMKKLDLKPLSKHRREQHLILVYKIVNDLIAIPAETQSHWIEESQDHQLLTTWN